MRCTSSQKPVDRLKKKTMWGKAGWGETGSGRIEIRPDSPMQETHM